MGNFSLGRGTRFVSLGYIKGTGSEPPRRMSPFPQVLDQLTVAGVKA